MGARENILQRIRDNLGKAGDTRKADADAARAYIGARTHGPRPKDAGADLAVRFKARAQSLASTVDEIAGLSGVPAAVARYLEERGLDKEGVCWPEFAALDWRAHGIVLHAQAPLGAEKLGITGAFCAIAETGTLVLVSGPRTPASTSLLPDTHIAVLPISSLCAAMEEAFELLRKRDGGLSRAVNFISGPSRTADIEQTVVLGAHGPYRVHIILLRT
jgi:L-lactate dehydrogenase complex protein LldG